MPSTRHLLGALRAAAWWLLVVSVFFGPAGLGGSAGFAWAAKTCGVSCPCDAAPHDEHADEHFEGDEADPCDDEVAAESNHDDGEPCKDECPDDCPNCGCCLGVAMAVLSVPVTSSAGACSSVFMLAPVDAPASRAGSGVFRPPRALI